MESPENWPHHKKCKKCIDCLCYKVKGEPQIIPYKGGKYFYALDKSAPMTYRLIGLTCGTSRYRAAIGSVKVANITWEVVKWSLNDWGFQRARNWRSSVRPSNPKPWRFGSDDFFLFIWVMCRFHVNFAGCTLDERSLKMVVSWYFEEFWIQMMMDKGSYLR